MKTKIRLTDEELEVILKACQPVTYMVIGGVPPSSPQENANRAWKELAKKRSFVWDSAEDAGTGDQHDVIVQALIQ